jgi:hypothetical protein
MNFQSSMSPIHGGDRQAWWGVHIRWPTPELFAMEEVDFPFIRGIQKSITEKLFKLHKMKKNTPRDEIISTRGLQLRYDSILRGALVRLRQ